MTASGAVPALDRFQRRHRLLGFPIAVVYKFFDDQGNYLAAIITYYAFVAIFPLLLIATSVLGFLLQNDPGLQEQILNSAFRQFPIVGDQLGRPEGLHGSTSAVVVGAVTALYGALGLGQASQNLMHVAWGVPRNRRPNPFRGRLRSLLLLATAGVAVLAVALLTAFGNSGAVFGAQVGALLRALITLGAVLINTAVFVVLFSLAATHKHRFAEAAPGAFAVAVMWQGLQFAGAAYVQHVIVKANDMNKTFALVLGLLALIYVAAVMAVLAVEINVVRACRFYPRALLTPFTDDVELTDADRRAYASYARAQRHKGFEQVTVSFDRDAPEAGPQ
jgi:YihY family inner membrane protein